MTDNELDAAAAAMLSPQPPEDRAAAARFGYMAAADTNPDVYAEAQRIARRTGVPTLTALNVPAVKKQAVMGEIPFEAIARDAPTTALMLADMEASKVIHDDIGNLTGVEKALRVLGNTGSAVLSAGPKFNEGAWGLVRAAGELMGAPGRPIVESATRLGQTARGQADSLMPKAGNVWEAGLYSGAQSFGVNLLQLPLALVPGGPAASGARMSPVLWSMGANTGGQAFAEARDKGVPLTPALVFGVSQGMIESGTEMLGMPALFSLLKPGKFGAKALEYMVKEQGGEQIATAMQDLNEWAVLPENANKTFGDYLAARPNAALQTAIATAVGGGAQVATVKAAGWAVNRADYQAEKARQAELRNQVLAELNTLAQANKVLQRSPETFQEFVAKATEDGPLQSVYIDGQTLMQSGLAEQVAAISPAVAEQVQQAAQTGGAVAIPVDEYAARIAPTDLAQQLQPHLRTEADGFSQAEAQQYMQSQGEQLQADLDRAVADSQQGDAFRASADVVTGQVRQQLDAAGRFTPQVNDAYARVVGAYYATRAAQLGVTPEALFERRMLTVGSRGVLGGDVLGAMPSGAPHLGEAKTNKNANGTFYTHTEEGVGRFDYSHSSSGVYKKHRREDGKVTDSVLNEEGDFVPAREIDRRADGAEPARRAWNGEAKARDTAARIAHFTNRLDLSDAAVRDLHQVLRDLVTGTLTPEQAQARANAILAGGAQGGDVLNQALASQPPKGWVHVTSGEEAAQMWEGEGAQAVFWTDLGGKLAQDVPGLAGYSHSLDGFAVAHIRKNHGDSKAEASRGQVAITEADITRIPEIVTGYDAVRTGLKGLNNTDEIAFAKRVDDGVLVYVARVSDKRRNLSAVSMWKYPPSVDAQRVLQSAVSGPNVQNERGHAPNLPDQGGSYNQGADQTDTPEFERWFGDSKVVDAEGKPLVVYHGTSADFDAFDMGADKRGVGGAWFSDSHNYAYDMAGGRDGRVIDAYLSLKNPKVVDVMAEAARVADELGMDAPTDSMEAQEFLAGGMGWDSVVGDMVSEAKREGHDGLIITSFADGRTVDTTAYIAFRSEQINPADPNILHQGAWHGTPHRGIEKTGFKLNKIGTGEGAQAYGWGMYFASAREVADGYRISLSSQAGHAPSIRGRSVISYYDAAEREGSRGGPLGYDKAALLERLMLHDSPQQVIAHGRDPDSGISPEAVAWFEREVAPHFKAGGQLYQAEIPEDSDLLDWDKPLSEQPEKLREALAQAREFAEAAEQLGGISIRRVDDGVLAGAGLYGAIERAAGSPKAASEYLNSIGIPGLRYLDGNSRASGEGSANYVIWDEALLTPEAARIEAVYNQGPRAAFNPERLAITLLGGADLSSFLHESGHFFFENDIALASEIVAAQRQGASITPGEQQMLADVGQLLTWHGLKGDVAAQLTEWHNMPFEEKRALHERTAESFEAYLFEGKAPSIELAPYFQRFRSWLLRVYTSLKDFLAGHPEAGTLTPEVRAVFDRMLATNDAIVQAEQGRSMLALFESAEQGGMTPEGWAAYQAQGGQATQDAVQDLQARGLRDLQWLRGARSRVLKRLQREAKAARDAAAVDVRREVMAEPVYRAWRFLTGRLQDEDRIGDPPAPPKPSSGLNREVDSLLTAIAKLGGIARESAAQHLGVHKDEFTRQSGVFGKPIFRKEGGLSADAMAELLVSEGYLTADENGGADLRELEELVAGELGGVPHYSAFRDPSLAFEELRAGDQVQDPSQLGAGRLDVASLKEMYGAASPYTARRQASTFQEAKDRAAAFAGEDKPALKNQATGMEAKVSRSNVAKMLSGKAVGKSVSPAVQALAVANVDKLFEMARLGETHPDRAGDPHIVAIHRFFAPLVTQDGQVYQVKLTVKELAGEANKVYTVEALEIESATPSMDPAEPGGVGDRVAPTVPPGGGASPSIARWMAQVKEAVGATTSWQRLTSHGMTATKGALHPDVAADILGGFDSGDALVQALLAATPLDEEIEARIDQRMLEQHGELATPEALEAAADAAIHSEARGRMVATELAALTKATGAPKVLADAARQFAAAAIARLKVRNLTPSMFSNAQAKAARNAAAALKKGDLALAAAEKRNEILQHYSAKAAHEARDEIERGRKYLAGFDGDVKGLDAGYLDQIAALLERFDLRKGTSLRAADKRKSLAAWLEAQREAGMEPDVPAELQNEAFTKSYKDMTVEEFRGLRDTVKQIEHLGRLKHKLLTAADQRAFDAVRDEIAASIGQHANGAAPEQSTPATDAGARKLKAHQFFLSHLKVANIAQRMDGGETGGPVWTFFARSAQERANWKAAKQAELTGKLMEIMRPVLARAGQFRTARARPALGISLTQEQVFALALNMGNEGNISRLLTGGINGRHFSHGQLVQLIDDELTAADLAAVQAIWDLMAELTPEAQAKHKRLYGREMELVAPTPLVTKHGTLRGGYYPIVYDPRGSVRVGENEADAVAKDALRAAHTAATTRRSYTKARLDETPYPLILTMGGVHRGLSQVVHDLAWHEWSMDVGRMLRDKTFQAAVLETYGLDYLKALQGWHEDIVTENVREQAGWERFGVHLRASVPAAAMGYSLLTAIQQPIGLTQSMARLGSGAVFKALAGFVGSPRAKITKARELSAFMRSRGITRFREVADLKRQIDLTGNRLRQAHSAVAEHAFDLLGWVQTCVDVPTWHAAFEKATAEGKDQATAVAVADQAVIDTQGDGAIQNLSGVQRDRFGKWLTLFYSYLSGALNMIWQTAHSERSLPRKTADILMLTMVPATLTALIKWAVKPGDDDDDEKYWKLVQQIMKENISLPLSMFVGIRELSDQAASLMVGEPVFSYQGPGSFRVVAETAKLLGQVSQGELDAGLGRSVINVAGSVTGLPSTQINRTIQGAQALADGETQNPAAVAFGFQKPR